MKDIRIFVASSKELEKERNYLAFLVLAKEDEFAKRGLRVRLAKWEYVDPKMTEARTEDRYLDEMYNCDAALVLFRDIAGMYTREELDKALAREHEGCSRLKMHQILFAADGKPDSDAAKLRESLLPDSYGIWSGMDELRTAFLSLVDRVAQCEGLVDTLEDHLRTVSAFLAADNELAADRNAFADTVLNLNDILARRGIRVRMRFYDASQHREMLESSEMALVLYHTNCNAFGPDQMHDAYDRTKREENPKRLYVFFRDEEEAKLDKAFVDFRNGFVEHLGHFFCRFENADTLRLNFLLSLENTLGDDTAFVKLDGKKVKADELEVGEITNLPMVAHNDGVSELMAQANEVSRRFQEQREKCQADPNNDALYVALIKLSAQKSQLEKEVAKELGRSFDLAKRMASVSMAEANETIARARGLLDQGRIDEAVQLLDGASSEIDDLLGDIGGLDDLMSQKLDALGSWIDVELFRADTVLAFAQEPFAERFEKVEKIYIGLLARARQVLAKHRPRRLASILEQFAKLYGKIRNTEKPVPLYEESLHLYEVVELLEPDSCLKEKAMVYWELGECERGNNSPEKAEVYYEKALALFRNPSVGKPSQVAGCVSDLASLHEQDMGESVKGGREYAESLQIWRELYNESPGKWRGQLAKALSVMANWKCRKMAVDEGTELYIEALEIIQNLYADDSRKWASGLAESYLDLARVYHWKRSYGKATEMYTKAIGLYRDLAKESPDKYEPSMAHALKQYALLRYWENKHSDAEALYGEATAIYRRFEMTYPGKFADYLTGCLKELASVHKDINKLDTASNELEESLRLARGLYERNEKKYWGTLSGVLNSLAGLYVMQNRLSEAESLYQESLALQRSSGGKDGVFIVLHSLASTHVSLDMLDTAGQEYDELILLGRDLARQDPAYFESWLSNALSKYGAYCLEVNKLDEAEKAYYEALQIRKKMAKDNPSQFEEDVASSLGDLGALYRTLHRFEDSEKIFRECLAILRRLAEKNREKFVGQVAGVLHGIGTLYRKMKLVEASARAFSEALAVFRELAAVNHEKYDSAVANTLVEFAELHSDFGNPAAAESEFSEALGIRRRLADRVPVKFQEPVSETLTGAAVLHSNLQRFGESESEFDEALKIREGLALKHPEKYNEKLADTLHEQAKMLLKKKDLIRAKSAAVRALEIRKKLSSLSFEKFKQDVIETEVLVADIEANQG